MQRPWTSWRGAWTTSKTGWATRRHEAGCSSGWAASQTQRPFTGDASVLSARRITQNCRTEYLTCYKLLGD